jgi:hypothetical protein
MQQGLLFFPCLALLLLTVTAMVAMFRGRRAAVQRGEISAAYFKTYDTGEKLPRKARQAERCYHNLIESTPPFYFVCAAAMALGKVDVFVLAFAWAYVAVRVLQSFVHLTSNKIGPRSISFAVAWALLLAMAIKLALAIV